MKNLLLFALFAIPAGLWSLDQPEPIKNNLTYVNTILPIFNRYCAYCHGPDMHIYGGWGGDLSHYDSLKVRIDNGKFREKVIIQKSMPPGGMWSMNHGLDDSTLQVIDSWLRAGAPYE